MSFPPVPREQVAKRIPPATRRDILDWFAMSGHRWSGRLEDPDFLSRLYDLGALPSGDYRFSDALGDIRQHRVNNDDWEPDWVFSDPRFNLLNGEDQAFLNFLVETIHPVVRPSAEAAAKIADAFNVSLRPIGIEIHPGRKIGDLQTWAWRERATAFHSEPSDHPISRHPKLDDRRVLRQHLERISNSIESDPPAAIASCKELLESICKIVLDGIDESYQSSDELPGLFAKVARALAINADSVPGDQRASDSIKKAMRTLTTTVQSVAEARNSMGTGHGSSTPSAAEPRHARLAFNATVAVAEFVLDSWAEEVKSTGF